MSYRGSDTTGFNQIVLLFISSYLYNGQTFSDLLRIIEERKAIQKFGMHLSIIYQIKTSF